MLAKPNNAKKVLALSAIAYPRDRTQNDASRLTKINDTNRLADHFLSKPKLACDWFATFRYRFDQVSKSESGFESLQDYCVNLKKSNFIYTRFVFLKLEACGTV